MDSPVLLFSISYSPRTHCCPACSLVAYSLTANQMILLYVPGLLLVLTKVRALLLQPKNESGTQKRISTQIRSKPKWAKHSYNPPLTETMSKWIKNRQPVYRARVCDGALRNGRAQPRFRPERRAQTVFVRPCDG